MNRRKISEGPSAFIRMHSHDDHDFDTGITVFISILPLKGQFQGQQTRGERGECSNKRIRTKNIFKIHMENFNFLFFSFC